MGLFSVYHRGDFNNIERFFNKILRRDYLNVLSKYGREGVQALKSETPVDSGLTAASWNFVIESKSGQSSIIFVNDNINKGVNIAVILQYGHGTGWGGYVQGRDYINPALRPVFDKIADEAWKEITSS